MNYLFAIETGLLVIMVVILALSFFGEAWSRKTKGVIEACLSGVFFMLSICYVVKILRPGDGGFVTGYYVAVFLVVIAASAATFVSAREQLGSQEEGK